MFCRKATRKILQWQRSSKSRLRRIWYSYFTNNKLVSLECGCALSTFNAIFILFDFANEPSFSHAEDVLKEVRKKTLNIPAALIGNKCDLQCAISREGAVAAKKLSACYYEVNSISGQSAIKAFEFIMSGDCLVRINFQSNSNGRFSSSYKHRTSIPQSKRRRIGNNRYF